MSRSVFLGDQDVQGCGLPSARLVYLRLSFRTKEVRNLCEKDRSAVKAFGQETAAFFQDAIAELRAAPTLGDIAKWSERMTKSASDKQLSFRIAEYVTIHFSVNHVRLPTDSDGRLFWDKVSSIKILKVEI